MATKRTLTLISRDTNNEISQKNISNVNPNATYQNLDTFARAFNALSTNTYVDSLVVNTVSLNEELSD